MFSAYWANWGTENQLEIMSDWVAVLITFVTRIGWAPGRFIGNNSRKVPRWF